MVHGSVQEKVNMNTFQVQCLVVATLCAACSLGCNSPYRADQGALAGGLGGAGLGALVGSATGHTGAGAAIGAAAGALSGAAVGGALDDIEARNRAEIAAHMGRPAPAGSVTVDDVIAMTRSGVTEDVILTHIRYHGPATPLRPADLIVLQQQGVSPRVVQALQAPPAVSVQSPPVVAAPYPYVVAAPPPYWGPYPYYGYYPYRPWRGPGVHWGVAVGR
jgi:hypothetical protein